MAPRWEQEEDRRRMEAEEKRKAPTGPPLDGPQPVRTLEGNRTDRMNCYLLRQLLARQSPEEERELQNRAREQSRIALQNLSIQRQLRELEASERQRAREESERRERERQQREQEFLMNYRERLNRQNASSSSN